MSFDDARAAFSPPGLVCDGYPLTSAFAPPRGKITTRLLWMEKPCMRLKECLGREALSAIVLLAVKPPQRHIMYARDD